MFNSSQIFYIFCIFSLRKHGTNFVLSKLVSLNELLQHTNYLFLEEMQFVQLRS